MLGRGLWYNRGSQSEFFSSFQKMALRAIYNVIYPHIYEVKRPQRHRLVAFESNWLGVHSRFGFEITFDLLYKTFFPLSIDKFSLYCIAALEKHSNLTSFLPHKHFYFISRLPKNTALHESPWIHRIHRKYFNVFPFKVGKNKLSFASCLFFPVM